MSVTKRPLTIQEYNYYDTFIKPLIIYIVNCILNEITTLFDISLLN